LFLHSRERQVINFICLFNLKTQDIVAKRKKITILSGG